MKLPRIITIAFWGSTLTTCILFSASNEASGLEIGSPGTGITQGNLVIHPQFRIKGEYDDNIFLTDTDRKDDLIGLIKPGVWLEFPWDDNLFRLDYLASLYYFMDNPQENHQDHRLKGRLNLLFSLFSVKIDDLFLVTSSRENTDYSQRIKRIENTGSIAVLYSANVFELQGKYKHFLQNYQKKIYNLYDHQENFGILTGFYRIAPKTKALLEYTYDRILYRRHKDRDGYYNEVRVGFKGEITAKLIGTAKVGYQERRYHDDSIWDNYSGLVGFISLEHAFSRNSDLRGGWERTARESTFDQNSYYLLNRGWLAYSQQLAHKIRGYIRIQYDNYRYPTRSIIYGKKRRDDIWEPAIGIKYQVQSWLTVNLEYRYKDRDSNFSGKDYQDNRVSLELSAIY